jgi:Uma2 family endonuclease
MANETTPHQPATLAELEALPRHLKGEIIDGVLYAHARPDPHHANIIGALIDSLRGPFQRGQGGPGGWWILPEPGIEVPGSPEFSPDLAGWRRTRLPALPKGRVPLVPDWICEILSPSTRTYDHRTKRPFFARLGVPYLWFVDPEARTLTISRLVEGRWLELGVFGEEDVVRGEPFEGLEIPLGEWWLGAEGA